MNRKRIVNTALMREKPDLVLKNARVINVFTGEIVPADIAVTDGIIVGTGQYSGKKERDLEGRYVCPGFVNAHLHVESSMVTPEEYAMEELRWGTTTLITDPHEFANVKGLTALRNILDAAERSPANYYVMLPSCVPCSPYEHAGAVLEAADLVGLKDHPCVLGLGEMMNSVGVTAGDENVFAKIESFSDMTIDGHFPLGSGRRLNAYVSAGIDTDHESISYEEAIEKLRTGLSILVREGSASRNLEDIMRGVIKNGNDTTRIAFCTDDKHLADIRREGTIRYCIKKTIDLGMDPVRAIQIGTINAARIYGLKHIGAIGCGYRADMVVLDDLEEMTVYDVYKDGVPVSGIKKSQMVYSESLFDNVHNANLYEDAFDVPVRETYSVIGIINNQIMTKKLTMTHDEVMKGLADGTVRKIAVIERHNKTGNHAAAYIKGYGLNHGAIGSTIAHDSHNIVVVGDNNADMLLAVNELKKTGGGYIVTQNGEVAGKLILRLCGLVSVKGSDELISELDAVIDIARKMGVNPEIDPFITLSFMALPVIPELRITDCGLFDVGAFAFTE